jgi:UDP-N-acetylglucosamine:LPS N-acetylglucosamine transferase
MISNPNILVTEVKDILSHYDSSRKMAQTFASFARPNAARDVANMIISSVK